MGSLSERPRHQLARLPHGRDDRALPRRPRTPYGARLLDQHPFLVVVLLGDVEGLHVRTALVERTRQVRAGVAIDDVVGVGGLVGEHEGPESGPWPCGGCSRTATL